MVKDIGIKQWRAMIKTAGSWKRPDVTAMVICFFLRVIYLLCLGVEVKSMCIRMDGSEDLQTCILN